MGCPVFGLVYISAINTVVTHYLIFSESPGREEGTQNGRVRKLKKIGISTGAFTKCRHTITTAYIIERRCFKDDGAQVSALMKAIVASTLRAKSARASAIR